MFRVMTVVFSLFMVASVLAEEPAKPAEPSPEAVAILKKSADAMKTAKTVAYKVEYKGTEWAASRVPTMEGTVIVGDQDKTKVDRFFCELKLKSAGAEEVREFKGGCNGDKFFLSDAKSKTVYQDMDPAVLGSQGRNLPRVVVKEFGLAEPFADSIKSGKTELKGSESVVGEDCHQVLITDVQPNVIWSISKKDFLPRRQTRLLKNDEGKEATTVLTVMDLKVNPTMTKDPFEPEVPEGFKKTDDFAP